MGKLKKIIVIITSILGVFFLVVAGLSIYTTYYNNPQHKVLSNYNIVEKQANINDVNFNYAESDNNGPALVLLHAQTLDWFSYNRVLPELSKYFHVYAIDYPGHGKTFTPEGYIMSANQIGSDLECFIDTLIQEPVIISGNSSGGLLAVWLAANRPDIVESIILEDPPLFSSEYNELSKTVADKLFLMSTRALESDNADNFLTYWINNGSEFFKKYTGSSFTQGLLKYLVSMRLQFNGSSPLEFPFFPPSVQEMIRGMNTYNPAFGAAFHDGSWNEGFDHADALMKIQCPTLLLQADFDYLEDGILDGAMSQEMADKACELIENITYKKISSGHVINLEVPDKYIALVKEFCLGEN